MYAVIESFLFSTRSSWKTLWKRAAAASECNLFTAWEMSPACLPSCWCWCETWHCLSSALRRRFWRVEKSKQRPASVPAADPTLFQLPSCFSLLGFSFHTSSVTFPSNVAAVKRQRELVTDRGVQVITSSCLRERSDPPQKQSLKRSLEWA